MGQRRRDPVHGMVSGRTGRSRVPHLCLALVPGMPRFSISALQSNPLATGLRRTADPSLVEDQRMRILVVSDLHYRLPHFDWLVAAAVQVDVVAVVGDLAQVVSPVPHEVQTVVLTRYLELLG